jgi:hypothetical protein
MYKNIYMEPSQDYVPSLACVRMCLKVCLAAFTQSGNLRTRKTHTGERPYLCDTCHAAFTHSCRLEAHDDSHGGAAIRMRRLPRGVRGLGTHVALVWPRPRVPPHVRRQRVQLRERRIELIALVWPLPSVSPHVVRRIPRMRERREIHLTFVRSLAGVARACVLPSSFGPRTLPHTR